MKKLILLFVLILALLVYFASYNQSPKNQDPGTTSFTLALDWTPNTNHTGIYVALQKGWYKKAGLDLKILPYSQVSADTLVASNKVDAGISSTESIVALSAVKNPVISIGAIVASNTSGIIVLENSGIESPKDLDGKIYGGFGLPYEEAVIKKIIQSDGGVGEFQNVILNTGAMQALESRKIDFVWVYKGWEAIIAEQQGLEIKFFPITEYGIPDYYTPTIITGQKQISGRKELYKKFMKATAKGYEFARTNPKEAAQILIDTTPPGTFPETKLVFQSQEFLSKAYAEKGQKWGLQSKEKWHNYPEFMFENNAVTDATGKPITTLDFESLYTNEFLK
ncbi:MAG TPA: ABC transporter substrate-binding protein [Candidatus Limnocylindrales bacterium]|nr:ABC transporter substrate-binding protein [Candidatus Limnocylindrales bacterium]